MISIIICSINQTYFQEISQNIKETIGDCPYELIKIDNNQEKLPLTHAYNKATQQATGIYYLFIHEDVIFHTNDWGKQLINLLQNEKTGCVGVAGSSYIPHVPVAWWSVPRSYHHLYLLQSDKKNNKPAQKSDTLGANETKTCYLLDGVFLACRKKVYQEFKFNETLLGFHGYDVDFSYRISLKYENLVSAKILIEHFSLGSPKRDWFETLIQLRQARTELPISQKNRSEVELFSYKDFANNLRFFKIPFTTAINLLLKYLSLNKLGLKNSLLAFKALLGFIFHRLKKTSDFH